MMIEDFSIDFPEKVEKVYSQRHMFESELQKRSYQGRGSAKSSKKAIEKAIKNAGIRS